MTVDDPVAPVVASGLPGDGVRRTNEIFTASAHGLRPGVRSLRVLVDGVARVDERYDCDYRLAAPCAPTRSRDFDLAGVPDGRHTVTTIAEDAASNVTRTEQVIDVDGTPPVVDRVPVSGRTVSVLVSDAGSGLAGGTIEVRTRRLRRRLHAAQDHPSQRAPDRHRAALVLDVARSASASRSPTAPATPSRRS